MTEVVCPRCDGLGYLENVDDTCFTCNGKCLVTKVYAEYMKASMANAEAAKAVKEALAKKATEELKTQTGDSAGLPHGLNEILKGYKITRVAPGDNVEMHL